MSVHPAFLPALHAIQPMSSQETLVAIEKLLLNDLANVREALEAAYKLGKLDGGIEMAKKAEAKVNDYADEMIRREQRVRLDGDDSHDMTTHGTPSRPGQ